MPLFYLTGHGAPGSALRRARDYPDLNAALAGANRAARSVLIRRLRQGSPNLTGSLDIEDETRRTVARVPLAELAQRISPGR